MRFWENRPHFFWEAFLKTEMREFKNLFFRPTIDKFVFAFNYDAKMVNEIKAAFSIGKRKYDAVSKEWFVDKDQFHSVNEFANKHRFTVANSALTIITEMLPQRKTLLEIPDMPDLKIQIPLRREPFDYQKKGMAYCIQHRNVLNGDQPGLGKTVQTIGSIIALDLQPALIICPAHLKLNWKDEWEMWTNWRAAVMTDSIAARPGQWFETGYLQAVIVNYEGLIKYFTKSVTRSEETGKVTGVELNKLGTYFKSIVWDEIQDCTNPKTQRYKVSDALRKLPNFEMHVALSGTPIKNKLEELMYILRLINGLDTFGGQQEFSKRYLNYKKSASGFGMQSNPQNLEELQYKIRTKHYFRREKHEVLKELPDKFRQVIKVEITTRKEYEFALKNFKDYLTNARGKSEAEIEMSMRAEILVQMMNLMQISARGKLEAIKEFVRNINEQEEKIVLFAHHREIVDSIESQFTNISKIVGGMTDEEKQKHKNAFQNNEAIKIIICSIKAASTGITLTAASRVAFCELPWTPDKIDQCEDRCHRIGQKDNVNAYYFIGENTIDEQIYDVLMRKRDIAKSALGINDNVQTQTHSTNDIFYDVLKLLQSN